MKKCVIIFVLVVSVLWVFLYEVVVCFNEMMMLLLVSVEMIFGFFWRRILGVRVIILIEWGGVWERL